LRRRKKKKRGQQQLLAKKNENNNAKEEDDDAAAIMRQLLPNGESASNNGDSHDASSSSYGSTPSNNATGDESINIIMDDNEYCETGDEENALWPSSSLLAKASGIAMFDIFAQSMVYTGKCMIVSSLLK